MGETPDQPVQPSEEELRTMLEEREQMQEKVQHRLAGIGTRVLAICFAALAIGFFSSSDTREAFASIFREPEPEPMAPTPSRPLPLVPANGPESVADELIRATNDMNAGPLAASRDGKIVTKEDIGFVMQLLNFAQGPPSQKAPSDEKPKER